MRFAVFWRISVRFSDALYAPLYRRRAYCADAFEGTRLIIRPLCTSYRDGHACSCPVYIRQGGGLEKISAIKGSPPGI